MHSSNLWARVKYVKFAIPVRREADLQYLLIFTTVYISSDHNALKLIIENNYTT